MSLQSLDIGRCLFLTPDSRMAIQLRHEIMDQLQVTALHGNRCMSFAMLLNKAMQLYQPLQGRPLSLAERQLLIDEIVMDSAADWPPFFQRSTLAAYLAETIGALKEQGVDPDGVEALRVELDTKALQPAQLTAFIDSYRRYQQLLRERRQYDQQDPYLALLALLQRLGGSALVSELAGAGLERIETLVLVGFAEPVPLQERIFRAFDADASLELIRWDSLLRPQLQAFTSLREIFSLGAVGGKGEVLAEREAVFFLEAADPQSEYRQLVGSIKERLAAGYRSSDCCVTLPRRRTDRQRLLQEFQEQQLPFDMLQEVDLGEEPLCRALLQLLEAADSIHDLSLPNLLRDPLLNPASAEFPHLAAQIAEIWATRGLRYSLEHWLERWQHYGQNARARAVQRGSDWPVTEWEDAVPPLDPFLDTRFIALGTKLLQGWQRRLLRLREARSSFDLSQALLAILGGELGWPTRALIYGLAQDDSLQERRRLEATWEAVVDIVQNLGQNGCKRRSNLLRDYSESLRLAFQTTKLQLPLGQTGGVQVLAAERLAGRQFRLLAVPDCQFGRFPSEVRSDWLLGDRGREVLGLQTSPQATAKERRLFAFLIGAAEQELIFSYSLKNERGEVQQRSGFLNQVAVRLGDQLQYMNGARNPEPHQTASSRQMLRSFLHHRLLQPAMEEQPQLLELWSPAQLQRLRHIRWLNGGSDAEGIDGEEAAQLQAVIAERMQGFQYSASSLQTYIDCPYRFLVEKLLALQPLREVGERLQPVDRGSIYHRIVQELLAPSCLKETALHELPRDRWQERLEVVLDAFWQRPRELQMIPTLWQLEKQRAYTVMERWLQRESRFQQGRVFACEWAFGEVGKREEACPLQDHCADARCDETGRLICLRGQARMSALQLQHQGRKLFLKGVIDRVDISDGGTRLVDYKSGGRGDHTESSIAAMTDIQLPIYALAWDRSGQGPKTSEILYQFIEAKKEGPTETRQDLRQRFRHSKLDIDLSWDEYQEKLVELIFDIDSAVRAAVFPARPRLSKICSWCPLKGLCPRQGDASKEVEDE